MADNRRYRKNRYNSNRKKENSLPREPHPQFENCVKLEMAVEEKLSEETLVRAVGICWNKYAWFEERESSFEEGSPEYIDCCESTDSWFSEYNKMTEKLKTFLGLTSENVFALPELTALMNKYGFEDVEGVWRKCSNSAR